MILKSSIGMITRGRFAQLVITVCIAVWAADAQDRAVAVVLSGEGGTYVRAKDEFDLALHPGEVLYAGDHINTGDIAAATLLLCPSGQVMDIPKGESAEVGKNQIKTRGRLRSTVRSLPPCEFPSFKEDQRAAEHHLGASLFASAGAQTGNRGILPPATEADLARLLTQLAAAENAKQEAQALTISETLASYWPNATQMQARIFVHGESVAASKQPGSAAKGEGSYAVVIGISTFQSPQASQLKYADSDARMIFRYLTDANGADIPKEHIQLLINSDATVSAIRDSFARIKSVRPERAIIFIASHGMEAGPDAYVIATDTNPQNPESNAISMKEINKDVTSELAGVKTVVAWIDTCNSGNVAVDGLYAPPGGMLFGFAASRRFQKSYEYGALGGGHGVFSWYLNEALNGGTGGRLSSGSDVYAFEKYVESKVAAYTHEDQIPTDFGNDPKITLASLNLKNPHVAIGAQASPGSGGTQRQLDNTDPLLKYENDGQQVILRYLDGDENPVDRQEFANAMADFAAAKKLAPESLWLEAREAFCEGRVEVFDKQYDRATASLGKAIQLDPSDALAYNALGVSLLQQAKYTSALAAFDDATRRAPGWAYAWHNKALAYTQAGDYTAAIRAYRRAIEVAPQYFYLPYNLGVLYQTLNRRKDAEASYRKAIAQAPNRAEPYNALGTLQATEGKRAAAEASFRKALELKPDFDLAQQNLKALH